MREHAIRAKTYLSSIGVVTNGNVCIGSSLQHSDIGRIKGCCCETVSNGIYVLAQSVMCCRSVALKAGGESLIPHFHLNGPAVLICCLLVSLLLKSRVASLQRCWRLHWPAVQYSQSVAVLK